MEYMRWGLERVERTLKVMINPLNEPSGEYVDETVMDELDDVIMNTELMMRDTERDLLTYKRALENKAWEN